MPFHWRLIVFFTTLVLFWLGCGGGSSFSTGGAGGGGGGGGGGSITSPPAQPVDPSPINGEVFYIVNQHSGLEADPNSGVAGDHVIIQTRSFTNLGQRWGLTASSAGKWKVSNLSSGLCLDSASNMGSTWVVANPCSGSSAQQVDPDFDEQWLLHNRKRKHRSSD